MAKQYVKPIIAFEKLSVGSEASAGCALQVTFAEFVCPVMIPEWGETVFTTSSHCTLSNGDQNICYHIPSPSYNVFSS